MSDKDLSLLFVGYKCKGKVKSKFPCYYSALYLTDEQQEDFIKWWHENIEPKIDKKIKELKERRDNET